MSQSKSVTKVAIVGATGNLGSHFVSALKGTGKHKITVLTRMGSTASFASDINVARVDYTSQTSLESVLSGQDFLIITLGVFAPPETHGNIIRAAAKARIPYVIPNCYGYDIRNERLYKDILYGVALDAIEDVKKIEGINFVALCCGFWYEWSLALGEPFLGFDITKRTVTFYDDGNTKVNTSTWKQCGSAIASLLSLPIESDEPGRASLSDWKNSPLFISSFLISQREILDSLHRVLGTTDSQWTITYEPSKKRYKKGLEELHAGIRTGLARAMYSRLLYPNGGGDFESANRLANPLLGMPHEDLDEATKRAVIMTEGDWAP